MIADDREIVVVGSQAILGEHPDAPAELLQSIEADLYPRNHPERADVIDESIGEGSYFHSTFGYYAQGVGPGTATLASGWESRVVRIGGASTEGAIGLCLDAHDTVLSKIVAGRTKDIEFATAALRHGLVRREELLARLERIELDPRLRAAVRIRVLRACGDTA